MITKMVCAGREATSTIFQEQVQPELREMEQHENIRARSFHSSPSEQCHNKTRWRPVTSRQTYRAHRLLTMMSLVIFILVAASGVSGGL